MSAEDIEASKAPLMDHLIELRFALIKALLAFGYCLHSVLLSSPSRSTTCWCGRSLDRGPRELEIHLHGAAGIFPDPIESSPCSAPPSSSFPDRGRADLTCFVAPGLYKARARRPSCLI